MFQVFRRHPDELPHGHHRGFGRRGGHPGSSHDQEEVPQELVRGGHNFQPPHRLFPAGIFDCFIVNFIYQKS